MVDTTITRNMALLKDVLTDKSHEECARIYRFSSKASVASCVRAMITHLVEHTALPLAKTSNFETLYEHRELIFKHLEMPFPKVSLFSNAKQYLREHFGPHYGQHAPLVAQSWDKIIAHFRFRYPRDLSSIKEWLASEAIYVGNMLSETASTFVMTQLQAAITPLNVAEGNHSFKVTTIKKGWDKHGVVIQLEIGDKGRTVTRELSLRLLPD